MKRTPKPILTYALAVLLTLMPVANIPIASALTGSDFRADQIIDDAIFFDSNTLGVSDIQAFLNSKVPVCDNNGTLPHGGTTRAAYAAARGVSTPFVCLKDYRQDIPNKAADAYCSGGIGAGTNIGSAQIIYEVSRACGVNAKVLLVLLQKEQSLITDDWPWPIQYRSATGYGCPDTAACDTEYYGFFNQLYYGARQYQRYSKQAQLFSYRSGRSNYIQFNPNAGCSGTNVYIQNQATAGLYNYTPYQPNPSALANLYGEGDGCGAYGNRNFWRMFNDWFGSTLSGRCSLNQVGGPIVTGVTFRKYNRFIDQGNAVAYTGTSTNCIESHTWNIGVTSWAANVATNHQVALPNITNVQYADLDGDGYDEPIAIELNQTLSGKIEFHVWNRSMNRWINHITTDAAATDLNNGKLTFADVDGDGRDEPVFILMAGTPSGHVEFQIMSNDLKTFRTQVVSHMPLFNRADGTIVFGDVDGNGVDEPVLVLYRNTGSGRVEFHTWQPGWAAWRFNTASQLASINPDNGYVTFADVDGNGVDEAVLIALRGTGSGRIEFHTWNLGVTSWRYNTATNANALN